ncbi:hypothetical protein J4Q44_G00235330 [Coregonus suidteri]|uniref:TGF-beta family profile domain-containing protein n=1 Tax=Coregonus suidteri TaxID=861788 RepID=A0AAN8LBD9_9TELE
MSQIRYRNFNSEILRAETQSNSNRLCSSHHSEQVPMGTPFRHKTVPAEGSEPAARASDGGAGLASLREQWKAVFATQHSDSQTTLDSNVVNSTPEFSGNTTGPHCCQLVSQIFIQDLGWENWIIYPESFTFTQCAACTPQLNPAGSCCKPASRHLVPVLYLDDYNTLVISSVYLTRSCSCTPQINPHHPTN